MMKFPIILLIIASLVLVTACEDVQENGSKLTPSELAYLRTKARVKCLSQTEKDYADFIADSNDELLRLTRDEAWKYEFKKDSAVINSKNIVVWKVDSLIPAIYFLVRVVTDSGVTLSKFYKVTPTINSEMFRDVQYKKCNQEENLTVNFSSSTITATRENDPVREDINTQTQTNLTYNYKKLLPALFGFLANTRVVKTLDNNETVTVTNTWESVITEIAKLPAQSTNLADYSNKRYCVILFTPAAGGVPATYSNPYSEKCEEDIATAGLPDFDPDVELVI